MNYGWKEDNGRYVPIWYEVKVFPAPAEVKALIKTTNKNFETKNNNEESIYSDSAASDCDSDWSVDANEDGDFHELATTLFINNFCGSYNEQTSITLSIMVIVFDFVTIFQLVGSVKECNTSKLCAK